MKLVEHLGSETVIKAKLPSGEFVLVIVPGSAALKPGEKIGLTFDEEAAHLFDQAGQRLRLHGEAD